MATIMLDRPSPGDSRSLSYITASEGLAPWLSAHGVSLAFTGVDCGSVFFVSAGPDGETVLIRQRRTNGAMGLAVCEGRLAVGTRGQIVSFVDAAWGRATEDGHDAVFLPQVAYYTGGIDARDIAFDAAFRPLFANARFSCLSAVSDTHSFTPLWQPPFISRLAPEDRCHLNGLAMRDGAPAFVTAAAKSDERLGWRDLKRDGGIVIDVASGEIVAHGLSMPHSPRLHNDTLYALNSGAGDVGIIEPETGRFEVVAFCRSFVRGMTLLDDFAVVGLSRPRHGAIFEGLPLSDRLREGNDAPVCGLDVVDLRSGETTEWLRFGSIVSEIYDVAVLPGIQRPFLAVLEGDDPVRMISIDA